jgi:uncharacterized protein YndB with AHSA1/START domain
MIDVVHEINRVHRQVGSRTLEAGEARSITVARAYDTSPEDLWDACTNPERIPRWFAPVSGDLQLGGRFQVEGNASGTIESCDPPRSFAATWEYGGGMSWIEVRLSPEATGGARFELEHTAYPEEHWEQYGPGALGLGYDMSLAALARHVATGEVTNDQESASYWASAEGKRFLAESGQRWCEADIAGGADPAAARAAADRTVAFYTA